MNFRCNRLGHAPRDPCIHLVKDDTGFSSFREKADLMANIKRDNSPPDATLTRGLKSSPGLVEM